MRKYLVIIIVFLIYNLSFSAIKILDSNTITNFFSSVINSSNIDSEEFLGKVTDWWHKTLTNYTVEKLNEMITTLEKINLKDEKSKVVKQYWLSQFYLKLGEEEKAKKLLEDVVNSYWIDDLKVSSYARLKLAQLKLQNGEIQEAKQLLEENLNKNWGGKGFIENVRLYFKLLPTPFSKYAFYKKVKNEVTDKKVLNELKKELYKSYEKVSDPQLVAKVARELQDFDVAAKYYALAGDLKSAADMYEKLSNNKMGRNKYRYEYQALKLRASIDKKRKKRVILSDGKEKWYYKTDYKYYLTLIDKFKNLYSKNVYPWSGYAAKEVVKIYKKLKMYDSAKNFAKEVYNEHSDWAVSVDIKNLAMN